MKKNGVKIAIVVIITLIVLLFVGFKIYGELKYDVELNKLTSDSLEIEKKWLIKAEDIPYNLSNADVFKIEQTYICFSPEMRVRKLNDGEQYTFALKTNITEDGMTRDETEFEISEEEYKDLVVKKEGNTIYKTRYQFLDGDNVLAIDIFSGDLEGLAYLEIEFANQEDANKFELPYWVKKDVTNDLNYKNGHLARYGIPSSYEEYIK